LPDIENSFIDRLGSQFATKSILKLLLLDQCQFFLAHGVD